jgi:hypothetical protein
MRRVKADASRHAHGKPLAALDGADPAQRAFDSFGMTYRERLTEVEREIAATRLYLFRKYRAHVDLYDHDGRVVDPI